MFRVSLIEQTNPNLESDDSLFPSLSIRQRIIGWIICYVIGVFLTFLSFGSLAQVILGRPKRFALLYTTGNLIALASTSFLVGPGKQWRRMWESQRIISTCIYLVSLVMTLFLCFERPHLRLLILLSVITQALALLWYSLSFVPFAHTVLTRVLSRLWL